MTLPPHRLRHVSLLGLMLWAAGMSAAVLRSQGGTPQFRAGVDLVRVEVQVVDDSGAPIAGIAASNFDVRIDGRKRQVTSAELIRESTTAGTTVGVSPPGRPTARNVWPEADGGGRRPGHDTASLPGEDGRPQRRAVSPSIAVVGRPCVVSRRAAALSPTKDRQAIRIAVADRRPPPQAEPVPRRPRS